ncbi:hypothetical protein M8818_004315 [Zalaria obscura]|uniref:Uncharacterized protein n=1 Tax=Zalaria obscura TaxID=2024903 RepID=A0ACC3SCC0_9PEZI
MQSAVRASEDLLLDACTERLFPELGRITVRKRELSRPAEASREEILHGFGGYLGTARLTPYLITCKADGSLVGGDVGWYLRHARRVQRTRSNQALAVLWGRIMAPRRQAELQVPY